MTVFINTETLEYPLFVGDIQPDFSGIATDFITPTGYAIVQEVSPPECQDGEMWYEVAPVNEGGVWVQKFETRLVTDEEKAFLVESAKMFDLSAFEAPNPDIDADGTAPDVVG